jgi:hypothetical protein
MNFQSIQINLLAAWVGILLGFVSGMVLGMYFRREDWLGGYASFKRRMYRLAHISCFGLGAVNLFFWLTVKTLPAFSPLLAVASWAFFVGAITMPLCCVVMAHLPKWHVIFAVPVLSLIAGGVLTLAVIVHFGQTAVTEKPTPDPSQGGEQSRVRRQTVPLPGGVRGGLVEVSRTERMIKPRRQT